MTDQTEDRYPLAGPPPAAGPLDMLPAEEVEDVEDAERREEAEEFAEEQQQQFTEEIGYLRLALEHASGALEDIQTAAENLRDMLRDLERTDEVLHGDMIYDTALSEAGLGESDREALTTELEALDDARDEAVAALDNIATTVRALTRW